MNHKRQVLEELAKESGNPVNLLEDIIEHSGIKEDVLVQFFCIYKFKYDLGVKYDRPTNYEEATQEWTSTTCAANFREAYDKRCNIHTIYERSTEGYDFNSIRA